MGVFMSRELVVPEVVNFVEYIQSSGTQYIDTGFKPNQDTRIVMDYQADTIIDNSFPFGAREGLTTGFDIALTPTQVFWHYGGVYQFKNFTDPYERTVCDANKNVATFTGQTSGKMVTITLAAATFTVPYSVLLFNYIESGAVGRIDFAFSGKVYSCKIYDNGTLIRDYKPCLDPNGIVCLYDLVNQEYVYNAGTGNFTAGGAV